MQFFDYLRRRKFNENLYGPTGDPEYPFHGEYGPDHYYPKKNYDPKVEEKTFQDFMKGHSLMNSAIHQLAPNNKKTYIIGLERL